MENLARQKNERTLIQHREIREMEEYEAQYNLYSLHVRFLAFCSLWFFEQEVKIATSRPRSKESILHLW